MAGEDSLTILRSMLDDDELVVEVTISPSETVSEGEAPGGGRVRKSPSRVASKEPPAKKSKPTKPSTSSALVPLSKSATIGDFAKMNIFKPDFPVPQFIDATLCHKEVRNFISKGKAAPSLQTIERSLLQSVSSLRFWESVVLDSEVLKRRVGQYVSKIEELQTCIRSLEEAKKKVESNYSTLSENYQSLSLELDSVRADMGKELEVLRTDLRVLKEDHEKMAVCLEAKKETEKKILKAWKSSVDEQLKNTLDQVQLLYPDADLSSVSAFKKVVDGKVVEIPGKSRS